MTNLEKYDELVRDQFEYGGKKYALANSTTRESTDELFDAFGFKWLLGTMAKYCFRYKNLKRERDILKIATYSYILWLKRGYFLQPQGLKVDAIDTNVKLKSEYFNKFIDNINQILKNIDLRYDEKDFMEILDFTCSYLLAQNSLTYNFNFDFIPKTTFLERIFIVLKNLVIWDSIKAETLYLIFLLCFQQWITDGYDKTEQHDTDTRNETK